MVDYLENGMVKGNYRKTIDKFIIGEVKINFR